MSTDTGKLTHLDVGALGLIGASVDSSPVLCIFYGEFINLS